MIEKVLGVQLTSSGPVSETEFKKLFNKGIFKQALVKIAATFDLQVQSGQIPAGLSLGRKLDTYQRVKMIKGIDPGSETHKDTKKMLFSLGEILTKNDPSYV